MTALNLSPFRRVNDRETLWEKHSSQTHQKESLRSPQRRAGAVTQAGYVTEQPASLLPVWGERSNAGANSAPLQSLIGLTSPLLSLSLSLSLFFFLPLVVFPALPLPSFPRPSRPLPVSCLMKWVLCARCGTQREVVRMLPPSGCSVVLSLFLSPLLDRLLSTVPLVSRRGSLPHLCLPERRLLKSPPENKKVHFGCFIPRVRMKSFFLQIY